MQPSRPEGFATAIHPALVRPLLLAGAERVPVVLEAVLTLILVLKIGFRPLAAVVFCFALFILHPLLVAAAKSDPQAVTIFLRSFSLQGFYPALASFDALTLVQLPFDAGRAE